MDYILRLADSKLYIEEILTSSDYGETKFIYNIVFTARKNLAKCFDKDTKEYIISLFYIEYGIKLISEEVDYE